MSQSIFVSKLVLVVKIKYIKVKKNSSWLNPNKNFVAKLRNYTGFIVVLLSALVMIDMVRYQN